MKFIILLFPILALGQKTITVKIDFEVIDYQILKSDTIYRCKEGKIIRVSKDSIYICGKHQYLKLKKQNGNQRKQNK